MRNCNPLISQQGFIRQHTAILRTLSNACTAAIRELGSAASGAEGRRVDAPPMLCLCRVSVPGENPASSSSSSSNSVDASVDLGVELDNAEGEKSGGPPDGKRIPVGRLNRRTSHASTVLPPPGNARTCPCEIKRHIQNVLDVTYRRDKS